MKWEIQGPDGKTYEVESPDGASEADVMARFKSQFSSPTDTLLNKARVVGTGAIEGTAAVGDALKSVLGKPNLPASMMPKGVVGDIIKQGGYGGTGFAQKLGLPTKAADEAKRLGVKMDPVTSAATAFARNAAPALLLRSGAPAAAMTGAGAAVGQTLGGDTGETIGAVAGPLALLGTSRALGNRAAAKAATPPQTSTILDEAKTSMEAFKMADAAVTKQSFGQFAKTIETKLVAEPIVDKALQPKTIAIFEGIQKKLADPNTQGLTMGDIWGIRRTINKALPRADADDARLLMSMKKDLNSYVKGLQPQDALYGDVVKASSHLQTGISKYAQGMAAKEIEDLIHSAKLYAQKHRSVSSDQALRNHFWAIAKNPDELRRFSPPVQEAITKVATGTPLRNALTFLGRFDPTSKILPGLAAMGAAAGGAHVPAIALGTVGLGSRLASNQMARKSANATAELIRRGAPAPGRRPLSKMEEAFLKALGYGSAVSATQN